ncbi:MAG: hypothetical protein EZS28_021008 [Streblomastix strix]|uniref:Uncharacterized protein n=1 Tax=Streblomastix strix TaxID=222440 RepID=A0A5J4VM00_9EUKA|nr:MAG: hypothetical protein EZS28_021008 [Streblomastix strix]
MIYEDQSSLYQKSNNRKVALYSFVIIVYEQSLGIKLRPEVQWFNQHDYTRSIDCDYNICWFIAASFQLHPEINNNKSRIVNAIELFLQFNDQVQLPEVVKSKIRKESDEFAYAKPDKVENPQVHAMFIKDIYRVVGGYLCKKCNKKLFNRASAHFGRDFNTLLESCKGPGQQKHPKLDKLAQPFKPYIKSDKTIQKLFATGQTKIFPKDQEKGVSDILQPTKNDICIDVETVEDQAQDDESIYAQLQPLSIVIDFDTNADYNIETDHKEYKFYSDKQNKKCESYIQQDNKAGRDTTNNVTANDIDYFNELIPNKCYYCQVKFTNVIKPTFERIDNTIAHTKDNCKLACQLCNSTRSNKDADVAKLMTQMFKYVIVKNLPMTIDDEEVYWFLRKSIHGGLSQVFHQYNIIGFTDINKLRYNSEENNVTAYDLDYIITHVLDLDFNSLYPSAFCGIYNKNNPYTGGKMYLPGRETKHIKIREANDQDYRDTKRKQMMNIINSEDRFSDEKGQLFIASVKGHIDKNHINDHINFPPIWRKRTYKTDEKTIALLLSTHDEFMSFSSYYLWLQIDYSHFIIDDINEIVLFNKRTAFKSFVEVMAENHQQAMREGNQAKQLYFENIVNSSYGPDGQNNEKFDKIESMFTQDNSKFWYLCFIYFFLYKCIDMDRVYFCCVDTDSMYLAISGSTIKGYKQQFKHAIKDQEFWDEHYKEWLPWECCAISEEKKLLGCSIESQRESIIFLVLKYYSVIRNKKDDDDDEDIDADAIRMKGVNEKNSGLTIDDYINCIENNSNVSVPVTQIQLKNGVMSLVKITKSALIGVVNNMIVIDSDISKGQSYPCAPQMTNIDASSYHYV